MAQVAITFNRRTYRFECAEADAERLERVSGYLRDKLESLIKEHGPIGDERLVLMAALTITDELFEARAGSETLSDEADGTTNGLVPPTPAEERALMAQQRKAGT